MSRGTPAHLYLRLALRAARLWILLRCALAIYSGVAAVMQRPAGVPAATFLEGAAATLTPGLSLPMALGTFAATLLDTRLAREDRLLANLGVGRVALACVAVAAALAMEIVLLAAVR